MKKIIYLSSVAIIAMALFSGCAKDRMVGPQGPAGYDGVDGNANVIGTNAVTVSWRLSEDYTQYKATINAPGITPDIVDKGTVQVFIQYGSEWWALPDIDGVNSTIFGIGDGYVSLINSNSDYSTPFYPSHSTFRVVIISASNRMANPDVNWNNFKEVKKALMLQE